MPRESGAKRRAATLRARFGWVGPAESGSGPALILISGLPGTGKSHLAAKVAAAFPVVVLRSDEVRKAFFAQPRYTPAEHAAVYLTCYELIRQLLRDGHAVVFDATNLKRSGRREARLIAEEAGAPFLLLVTVSPPEVVAERLRRRAAGQGEAYSSDADWRVHELLAGTVETGGERSEPAVVVDTSCSIEPALEAVAALVGRGAGTAHSNTR